MRWRGKGLGFASCHLHIYLAVWGLTCLLQVPAVTHARQHPLDALTADEINTTTELLRAEGQIDKETRLLSLTLEEPAKSVVLAWYPGDAVPRAARAVSRREGKTVEVLVDLVNKTILTRKEITQGQGPLNPTEVFRVTSLVRKDPRVIAQLAKRGITDPKQVTCGARTVGNFGREEERTRRLVKFDCFDLSQDRSNRYATPIEGLYITVDVDEEKILEVIDTGVVPTPPGTYPLVSEAVAKPKARQQITRSRPRRQPFTLDGSFVSWEKWRFHLRWDIRAGLIVSLVDYLDAGRKRSVLYQGHIAEIFVPYQDPSEGWYYRAFLDQGDYGLGVMSSPLVPGVDCPADAEFLSPTMMSFTGTARVLKNRICIFAWTTSEPIWRHGPRIASHPNVELVVRFIATVGNYDYLCDWVFDRKGNLTFRSGATGIDAVKGVTTKHLSEDTAAADTKWGPLIAPGRVGINHDHFFSLRLDVDIDGTKNRFVHDRLVVETPEEGRPRTSLWRVQPEVVKSDTEAKFRISNEQPRLWRVQSVEKTNALGSPTSYVLRPGINCLPLVDVGDSPLARALFANYQLWVTPYAPDERYAAGVNPNQSTPGEGLPAWTSHSRNLDGEDIVLWYTMGFHHVPSAEDWPVLNLGWHTVTLSPYNFFDHNPVKDPHLRDH